MNIFEQYKHLPKEDQRKIKKILRKAYIEVADIEATVEHKKSPYADLMGGCHVFWSTKKRILKEKYGIEWKTPAEKDSYTIYD